MRIPSDGVLGIAPVLHADAAAGEALRVSREQPCLGARPVAAPGALGNTVAVCRDKHGRTDMIAPPHRAIDGESLAGRPVNERSLRDYVRAILGMEHDATKIDPGLAPYLDELSKVESTDRAAQAVSHTSFGAIAGSSFPPSLRYKKGVKRN